MKKDKKMIVCFLTPALFMFSVIFLYPVLRTIAMSFFQVEGVSDAFSTWKFTGLDNYITLLQTPIFLDSMKNMLKISSTCTTLKRVLPTSTPCST